MASAVELVWQWAFLISILLIVMILCCCFGGCWGSFIANVRGCCSDGVNCGFAPFRKKKKKVLVTKKTKAPNGDVLLKVEEAEDLEATRAQPSAHEGPWHGICGGFVSLITCCYCCGALKPEGEDEEEGEEMLPKNVVAQPVTIVSPVPAKKPPPPVVKAEPVVRIAPAPAPPAPEPLPPPLPEFRAPPREIGQGQGATGAHMPLLHFYTLP